MIVLMIIMITIIIILIIIMMMMMMMMIMIIIIIIITRSTQRAQTSVKATGPLMLLNCLPFGMAIVICTLVVTSFPWLLYLKSLRS